MPQESSAKKGLSCETFRAVMSRLDGAVTNPKYGHRLFLVGEGVMEKETNKYLKVVKLIRQNLLGVEALHVVPASSDIPDDWWDFGGCFIYSKDPAFPHPYPIPVYDQILPSKKKKVCAKCEKGEHHDH